MHHLKYIGIRIKSTISLFVRIAVSMMCQLRNNWVESYHLPHGQRDREKAVLQTRGEERVSFVAGIKGRNT